jgi:hypothetical protein
MMLSGMARLSGDLYSIRCEVSVGNAFKKQVVRLEALIYNREPFKEESKENQ